MRHKLPSYFVPLSYAGGTCGGGGGGWRRRLCRLSVRSGHFRVIRGRSGWITAQRLCLPCASAKFLPCVCADTLSPKQSPRLNTLDAPPEADFMSHIGSGAPPATMMDDQRMARGAGGGRVREGVQRKDPPTCWWYVGHSKG